MLYACPVIACMGHSSLMRNVEPVKKRGPAAGPGRAAARFKESDRAMVISITGGNNHIPEF